MAISDSAIIVLCIVAAGVVSSPGDDQYHENRNCHYDRALRHRLTYNLQVVLVAWAVSHRNRSGTGNDDEQAFYAADSGPGTGAGAQSQFQHMRETRERYKEEIIARFGHRQQRPRRQSIPLSAPISHAPTNGPSDYSYY